MVTFLGIDICKQGDPGNRTCFIFYLFIYFYLKYRERDLPVFCSALKGLQQPGLGQTKASGWERKPGLPVGDWTNNLLLFRVCINHQLDSGTEVGLGSSMQVSQAKS